MSWQDALKGSLGSLLTKAEAAALPIIFKDVLSPNNLQAILAKLEQQGMNEHVRSWLDEHRQNLPVTAEQLQSVLGNEQVRQWAL